MKSAKPVKVEVVPEKEPKGKEKDGKEPPSKVDEQLRLEKVHKRQPSKDKDPEEDDQLKVEKVHKRQPSKDRDDKEDTRDEQLKVEKVHRRQPSKDKDDKEDRKTLEPVAAAKEKRRSRSVSPAPGAAGSSAEPASPAPPETITYAHVKPLLGKQMLEGDRLEVIFRAPNNPAFDVFSQAVVQGGKGKAQGAKRLVTTMFGVDDCGLGGFTAKEIQAAVLEAFTLVLHRFTWDGERFRAPNLPRESISPFFRQLEDNPVTEKIDQGTMTRFLTEIAHSDGVFTVEEQDFLSSYTPQRVGHLEDISRLPDLERQDLERVSPGRVRDTIIMLGWAMALGDQTLEEREEKRIKKVAKYLDMPKERLGELKQFAQVYVIDRMCDRLGWHGKLAEKDQLKIIDLCQRFSMTKKDFEEARKRFETRVAR